MLQRTKEVKYKFFFSQMIDINCIISAALMALKRKKTYEANIEKINGARMTIETQMMAIENANVNLETMGAMRAGAEAMKNIHGSMYVLNY